jgi:hypothetical protein
MVSNKPRDLAMNFATALHVQMTCDAGMRGCLADTNHLQQLLRHESAPSGQGNHQQLTHVSHWLQLLMA